MAEQAQIITDPNRFGGRPFIAGTDVEVAGIVIAHDILNHSADQIAAQYHLSQAQIYAALSYYHAHKADFDALIQTWKTRHERNQPKKTKRIENQDIFWLNTQNKNFESKRVFHHAHSEALQKNAPYVIIAVFGLAVFMTLLSRFNPIGFLSGASFNVLLYLYIAFSRIANKSQLERIGIILDGVILRGTRQVRNFGWIVVKVRYQFSNPNGNLLVGENEDVTKLLDGEQPTAGRPVRVVYVDDNTFRML